MANEKDPQVTETTAASDGAISRVIAMHDEELRAADTLMTITKRPTYNDFFVDSPRNGPPFHERFGDHGPPALQTTTFSPTRMTVVSRLADGGYSDFFVEGSGPPWHESVGAGQNAPVNEFDRAKALLGSGVLRAYARLKADSRRAK
jgi:hypothetical protein